MPGRTLKIVTIVGARPQFVKAARVSCAIQAHNRTAASVPIHEVLVHTGQHYDDTMSDVFFRDLDMPEPAYWLAVGSASHGQQTAMMLTRIEDVLIREHPDAVVVYGDTNSTLAGALAAAKLHIPVAHVEAGLRSYNRRMPEETNRVLTDHVSTLLLCPTDTAVSNLARESITEGVHLVGDVMHESVLHNLGRSSSRSDVRQRLGLAATEYALATLHRAENTDQRARLRSVMAGLEKVAAVVPVVLPLHPRTAKSLADTGMRPTSGSEGMRVIEPVSYLDMLHLEQHAAVVLTDSGGVQKEAYWLGVPCVTLRDETEWVETVASGWNRLAGSDTERIWTAFQDALTSRSSLQAPPLAMSEPRPSEAIVGVLHGTTADG